MVTIGFKLYFSHGCYKINHTSIICSIKRILQYIGTFIGAANAIPTRQIFPDSVLINARIEELDNASVSEAISCTISAIVVNLLPCTKRRANG